MYLPCISPISPQVRATFAALIIFVLLTVGVSIMFEVLLSSWDSDAPPNATSSGWGAQEDPAAVEAGAAWGADVWAEGFQQGQFSRWTIPWFAMYGHISPQALTSPHATSYIAPVVLWLYMLTVQLGMLNLLIAIMTDTYFKVVQGAAEP